MNRNCKHNPCLTAGLLMELLYLCSDHLVPVERMLGAPGAFLCGMWQGAAAFLMLIGLLTLSPKGRKWLTKRCVWKRKTGRDESCW